MKAYRIEVPEGHTPCPLSPRTLADTVTALQRLPTGSRAYGPTSPEPVAVTGKRGRVAVFPDACKAPSRRAVQHVKRFSNIPTITGG